MRPFTKVAIVVLFALIVGAAISQILIAMSDRAPFPGPVPGTPLPTASPSA